jgi:RNA polymerase sigma-70 factor (ECF subfamily)
MVLALRYSGLSYAEVASSLGIGVNAVGTRLRRAEARLRKEVGDASV